MSKPKRKAAAPNKPPKGWWVSAAIALVVAIAVVAMLNAPKGTPEAPAPPRAPAIPAPPRVADITTNEPTSLEANQSVVVTQDLDFGTARPTLAEAMAHIERRWRAEDGTTNRTFAILEAFNGEVQPDGRTRVSLRISTEKPGVAQITTRGTNELWKCAVKPATHKSGFAPGQLTILFDNGEGKTFTVDGSTGPATIFEAMLKEPGLPVSQVWPEAAERELSFIFSACGCPIKVMCRRVGNRSVRTKAESQVIFPDDPAAMQVITRLMGW